MAGMTLALTEFATEANSKTSTFVGHTVAEPQIVIERRTVPENGKVVAEYRAKVVHGTVDSAGSPLTQKISFEIVCRYPVAGLAADMTEAIAQIRDIVASDDFANSVNTQEWL